MPFGKVDGKFDISIEDRKVVEDLWEASERRVIDLFSCQKIDGVGLAEEENRMKLMEEKDIRKGGGSRHSSSLSKSIKQCHFPITNFNDKQHLNWIHASTIRKPLLIEFLCYEYFET